MPRIHLDMSEVAALAADLRAVDGRLARHLVPAVSKGALNIKQEMQANFRAASNPGVRHVGNTISYDLTTSSGEISAEIGPTKPSGALANVAIWGTSKGGGGVPDPSKALANEATAFGKALADIAEEILW
jgi:hypothetical protein